MRTVFIRVAHNFLDLTGQRFGRLVVISYDGCINKKAKWKCVCDCGNEKTVDSQSLRVGHTRSCGCIFIEMLQSRRKHGSYGTPEYKAWARAIQRCSNNKNISWANYGGRGISVCEEWRRDFGAFLSCVGKRPSSRHSLDRIDNDGNYEPGNVRWATHSQQMFNRRKYTHKNSKRYKK